MYAYTAGCLLYLDIGTAQKSKRLFHLKPVEIIYKGVAGSLLKQNTELALSQGAPSGRFLQAYIFIHMVLQILEKSCNLRVRVLIGHQVIHNRPDRVLSASRLPKNLR